MLFFLDDFRDDPFAFNRVRDKSRFAVGSADAGTSKRDIGNLDFAMSAFGMRGVILHGLVDLQIRSLSCIFKENS